MKRLGHKVVVITGAASGIGDAAARQFAEEGATVVIADLQQEKGEALARAMGGDTLFQRTDVTCESDVHALIQNTVRRFGRIDCLYNNAGFGCATRPIAETPLEEFESQVAVLLRGTFLGIKHAAAEMKKQRAGSIVNTSSVAGIAGGYSNHVYSAAKAGVISLTRSTALELGEHGIRVNCVCPASIPTPIFVHGIPLTEEEVPKAVEKIGPWLSHNPLGRCGTPEDIARAALWLASDESAYVTGQAIVVDGGLTSGLQWSTMQQWLEGMYGELARNFPRAFAELATTSS